MRRKLPKILVTGGAGFIGSEFVRTLVKRGLSSCRRQDTRRSDTAGCLEGETIVPEVVVVDNLTYAGDLKRLEEVKDKFKFYKVDICDQKKINAIFSKEKPDIIVNFAASTHVDRSIIDASPFIETNIKGVQVLLDASKKYGIQRAIHISSDEVYGDIENGEFSEDSPLQPNSPYAASKAAADLLIKSYIRTYGLPVIIVRPSNNYGPWQYPEKLVPVVISKALKNQAVPVYARGENIREWLYVSDCANAILSILQRGKAGQTYNLGSGQEKKNIDVVKQILKILGKPQDLIKFVKDRPGHDIRYRLNSEKISHETGWMPKVKFEQGIRLTVNWCLRNKSWLLSKH